MEKITLKSQDEINVLIQHGASGSWYLHKDADYIIDFDVDLAGKKFSRIQFKNWKFNGDVNFSGSIFEKGISFENVIFEKNVDFTDTHFQGKTRFYRAKFKGQTTFYNTKFDDLADFWRTEFLNKVIFYKCDFSGTTVFPITKFHENVLFTYSTIPEIMFFRDTTFKKGFDLSLAVISGQIGLFNLNLSNYDDIPDTEDEEIYENYVATEGIITRKNQRETYRIIKNQLKSQNNNIDALHYYALESEVYYKQLKNQWYNKLDNWSVFGLNRLSNKYGQSWVRAVIFTLLVALTFFYFTIVNTTAYDVGINSTTITVISANTKSFFEFLLPTHSVNFIENKEPDSLSYFFDFLGRIFISYGIYQIVQAFRRFKNH